MHVPEGIVWYQSTSDGPGDKAQRQGGQKLPRCIESPIPRPLARPGSNSCPAKWADLSTLRRSLPATRGAQMVGTRSRPSWARWSPHAGGPGPPGKRSLGCLPGGSRMAARCAHAE
jgi:hypothetical protein